MCNPEQNRLTPEYEILHSSMTLVKHYHVNYVENEDKTFKISFQCCNGYVKYSGRKGEKNYMTFIRAGISSLKLYPGEVDPEHLLFQCHDSTKLQQYYLRFLKKVNSDHKYLKCPYIWYRNFELLRTSLAFEK